MSGRTRKPESTAEKAERSPQEKRHLDVLLDEGLKETFPASDAFAILDPLPGQHRPESKSK